MEISRKQKDMHRIPVQVPIAHISLDSIDNHQMDQHGSHHPFNVGVSWISHCIAGVRYSHSVFATLLTVGDPTTPGSPSTPGCDRTDGSLILPQIPSIPISYRDAIPILKALDGYGIVGKNVSRDGWIGGLNASYSTGPSPGAVIRMANEMEEAIKPLWNVIGIINGTRADETIIIGNHRDAWIIGGAADPNSGTAVLVELAKAFGKLLKTGWVPRRNMFVTSSSPYKTSS